MAILSISALRRSMQSRPTSSIRQRSSKAGFVQVGQLMTTARAPLFVSGIRRANAREQCCKRSLPARYRQDSRHTVRGGFILHPWKYEVRNP